MAAPISGIFWLHFCTVRGSGGASSIFKYDLSLKQSEMGSHSRCSRQYSASCSSRSSDSVLLCHNCATVQAPRINTVHQWQFQIYLRCNFSVKKVHKMKHFAIKIYIVHMHRLQCQCAELGWRTKAKYKQPLISPFTANH